MKKQLTKEDAIKYVKGDGYTCPYCESERVETEERNITTNTVHCNNCGESWAEAWKLVGLDEWSGVEPINAYAGLVEKLEAAVHVLYTHNLGDQPAAKEARGLLDSLRVEAE